MPILRSHATQFYERRMSSVTFTSAISTLMFTCGWGKRGLRARRFVQFWASGGTTLTKMGDSLPWTLINRRAKLDAASFIHGGEIRNRTNTHNKHTNTQTNSKRYIYTLPIGM